jgi:hypothetical protein
LRPNPRPLRELWVEYKFGIDGRKSAEQFNAREKNEIYSGNAWEGESEEAKLSIRRS